MYDIDYFKVAVNEFVLQDIDLLIVAAEY